jgi:hypothetical protein
MAQPKFNVELIKPKISRTNILDKRLKDDLIMIAHHGVVLKKNFMEIAVFIRIALNRLTSSNAWCVVVGQSIYSHVRVKANTSAILTIPCLMSDVLPDGKIPSPAPAFTVLVFQLSHDVERKQGCWSIDDYNKQSEKPVVLRAPIKSIPVTSTFPSDLTQTITRIIGGVQHEIGCNYDTEATFCARIKEILTALYGSTFDIILTNFSIPIIESPDGKLNLDIDISETANKNKSEEYLLKKAKGLTHSVGVVVTAYDESYLEVSFASNYVEKSEQTEKDSESSKSSKTPERYHLILFRADVVADKESDDRVDKEEKTGTEATGNEPDSLYRVFRVFFRRVCKNRFHTLRIVLYTLGSLFFFAYILTAYGSSTFCARKTGVEPSPLTSALSLTSVLSFFDLKLLYPRMKTQISALISPFLTQTPSPEELEDLLAHSKLTKCSIESIMFAEKRIARGNLYLFLLFLIIISISILRFLQKQYESTRIKTVLKTMPSIATTTSTTTKTASNKKKN